MNADKLIEFKKNNPNITELTVNLYNLTINDPCVSDDGKEVCQNDGTCNRNKDYRYNCLCKQYYAGNNCEIVDYCKMNFKNSYESNENICRQMGLKCLNNNQTEQFECVCPDGFLWNGLYDR